MKDGESDSNTDNQLELEGNDKINKDMYKQL